LHLYEPLTTQGYQVLVLNPLYVEARRGTKTDAVDARLLAEILQREDVLTSHVPEADVEGLRDWTRLRVDMVARIGDVKRRISSILDRAFPEFATCFTEVCGQAARTRRRPNTVSAAGEGPRCRPVSCGSCCGRSGNWNICWPT
jgi:transposase